MQPNLTESSRRETRLTVVNEILKVHPFGGGVLYLEERSSTNPSLKTSPEYTRAVCSTVGLTQ